MTHEELLVSKQGIEGSIYLHTTHSGYILPSLPFKVLTKLAEYWYPVIDTSYKSKESIITSITKHSNTASHLFDAAWFANALVSAHFNLFEIEPSKEWHWCSYCNQDTCTNKLVIDEEEQEWVLISSRLLSDSKELKIKENDGDQLGTLYIKPVDLLVDMLLNKNFDYKHYFTNDYNC